MPEFPVLASGVDQFYRDYKHATEYRNEPPSHDGLAFAVSSEDPEGETFDFFTQEPIPPGTDSPSAPAQRTIPGLGYFLGRFNYRTFKLEVDERNYNNGTPTDPILTEGFKNLAKLFGAEVPLK